MQRWRRAGRLDPVDARLTDLEDAQALGGAGSLGDEVEALGQRLGQLAGDAVTQDEMLQTRLELARLAGEVGRLTAQVRALADRPATSGDLDDEPDWAASA